MAGNVSGNGEVIQSLLDFAFGKFNGIVAFADDIGSLCEHGDWRQGKFAVFSLKFFSVLNDMFAHIGGFRYCRSSRSGCCRRKCRPGNRRFRLGIVIDKWQIFGGGGVIFIQFAVFQSLKE